MQSILLLSLVSQHQWRKALITDATIACVAALGHQDGQPVIQADGLVVEWQHDQKINPGTYDVDFVPPADTPDNDVVGQINPDELADSLLAPPEQQKARLLPPSWPKERNQ